MAPDKVSQLRVSAAVLLISCLLFSVFMRLIPPMQSPDEGVHLIRAYLLSKGVFVLDTIPGQRSGGYVDENLIQYQHEAAVSAAFNPEKKITNPKASTLSMMEWSGKAAFAPVPNTGYYFPLIYVPQAIGLRVGEFIGLTIQNSYYLARLSAFLSSVLLLMAAFRLFPPNPVVIALMVLPMSLFQFVSASMDGVAFGLSVLCISLFMRGSTRPAVFPDWMSYVLVTGLLVLVTSRIQVLAFILMPFALALHRRRALYLWQGLALTVLAAAWLYLAITQTVDGGVHHPEQSHLDVVKHYLTHLPELAHVFKATVESRDNRETYLFGFIGILGWLDTAFSVRFYKWMGIAFAIVMVLSISWSDIKETWQPRLALVVMFLASVFTVFFALLIQWNPFPASSIAGVQGRYFIVPFCALAYALSGVAGFKSVPARLAILGLIFMVAMVAIKMPQVLVDRYFVGVALGQ